MNAPLEQTGEAHRVGLTARDFWVLAEAGAFDKYAKVELTEGEIWAVNSVWRWHARVVMHVGAELTIALRRSGSALVVYGDGSVELGPDNVPQPDVCIGEELADGKALPLGAVKLAIEVSEATLARDLGIKARLYGSAGIPEYWVVDREHGCVVQMWRPDAGGYAERRSVPFGGTVQAVSITDVTIDTATMPA